MTVTTRAQLEALPEMSVIRDRYGDVGIVQAGMVHYPESEPQTFERTVKKYGPLDVLWTPTPAPLIEVIKANGEAVMIGGRIPPRGRP